VRVLIVGAGVAVLTLGIIVIVWLVARAIPHPGVVAERMRVLTMSLPQWIGVSLSVVAIAAAAVYVFYWIGVSILWAAVSNGRYSP
jgi:hypothetical protein